ncbi:enoyl-CoA hydratase/isomerase family protein [Aeromicrobium wangtongii]|uniref:enoyl-CoA hydratase/isomerase family protein n=1 Tax=Aeromicrobium wangtongii TaxID=2969247 RepID=UPI002017405B|nr:enoyl-CoA hydratase/isomerase family protein [Aeromicrobium wangtongii]MCL3819386.1 enoyl-CoA hydratase/isomerase family protein [Aeromicrobium wangtongii]
MSGADLVVEHLGQRVALVRMDRPAKHNALDGSLITAIADAIATLAESGTVGAIVLTGSGERAFSAGADLQELAGLDRSAAIAVMTRGQAAFRQIELSPVPVVAAVNGIALGGGFELALACSFTVLSEGASLGLPETGLGLIPGYGGTQRLTRVAGPAVARYVALSGARISAEQAYQWGMTPVPPVPSQSLLPHAIELAEQVAARGPRANASVLALIDRAGHESLDGGLAAETRLAAAAIASDEGREGTAAFTERRAPRFAVPA